MCFLPFASLLTSSSRCSQARRAECTAKLLCKFKLQCQLFVPRPSKMACAHGCRWLSRMWTHFFVQFLEHKQHKQTSYNYMIIYIIIIILYIYILYVYIIIYIYAYKYIHSVRIRISSHRAAGLYTEIAWARLEGMDQRWQLLAHLDRLEKVLLTSHMLYVLMSLIDAWHIIIT